jgi:hypothetical protein
MIHNQWSEVGGGRNQAKDPNVPARRTQAGTLGNKNAHYSFEKGNGKISGI